MVLVEEKDTGDDSDSDHGFFDRGQSRGEFYIGHRNLQVMKKDEEDKKAEKEVEIIELKQRTTWERLMELLFGSPKV